MPSLDVFISHSSKNKEIAAAVIGLLRSALNISATKIRCTSVDGYKLPGGASVDDQLRQETQDSRCFIGIVTQDAIESTFTIFELGARWGASKPFIPIVPTPADKNLLKRPLSDLNALLLINPAEVHQLVGDVARMLGLEQERPEVFRDNIDRLVELCEHLASESVSHIPTDRVPSVIRRSEPRMPRFDRSFQRKQRHDKCRPNWLSILSRDDERPRWLTKKISPAPLRLKSST